MDRTPRPRLTAARRDSRDVHIIELSHTLHDVASGLVQASVLSSDLRVGHTGIDGAENDEPWFGIVADVASLGHGRFAVLDKMRSHVFLFDSVGQMEARLGRTGEGPGEYEEPWALAAVGEKLVVWQAKSVSTFTVLGPTGEVLATSSRAVEGDWIRPKSRFPILRFGTYQMGPEDVSRRLASLADSGFVHQLQLNEQQHTADRHRPPSFPSPPVYLIRYGLDGAVRDTLAVLSGPPTLLKDRVSAAFITYRQPLFSARPVWALGNGWIALGHGDSARVVVRRFSGDTLLSIRWPHRRVAVTDDDRIDAARWIIAHRILNSSTSRERYERESRAAVREGIERTAFEWTSFPEFVPAVTAAYAAGQCLFLAGHAPRDWVDGTALTWVAMNVESGTLEAVFRIPPPAVAKRLELDRQGAAVREIDGRFVYVSYRDGDGVYYVERFQLPPMNCGLDLPARPLLSAM